MKGIIKKRFVGVLKYGSLMVLLCGIMLAGKLNTYVVKADCIELTPWIFYQTGTTTSAWNSGEKCAYSSVTGVNGETLKEEDFPLQVWDEESEAYVAKAVTTSFSGITDGFDADILSNGWSVDTGHGSYVSINPYTVTAHMENLKVEKGHSYTVTFTGSATSKKYVYVEIRDKKSGQTNYLATVSYKIIALDTTSQTYSITFKSNADAYIRVRLMLGAFNATYDYSGNDISDIINPLEKNWTGTVSIRNFALEDITDNQTTVNTVTTTNVADSTSGKVSRPARVKSLKITRKKGRTVSLTWKKINKANGYQIVYARNKKFTKSKKKILIKRNAKTTKIIKNLKKGKTYYFRVRAYKSVNGKRRYGKFSKVKKIKIK